MFKNKEYILSVYREGGFTKAAEKMFISQPSLSASVKRIEEKVGLPIFDRSNTPLTLTEVGEEYVKYAIELEQKEADFAKYVSDYGNLMIGKIRVGGSSFFSSFILPKMISAFNTEYKEIVFELFEGSTKNLIDKLYTGDLDVIIDNAIINDENIEGQIYTTERLLLAVPKGFSVNQELEAMRITAKEIQDGRYIKKPALDLTKLQNEPFVLLNGENDTGKRAEMLFKKYNLSPNVLFRLDQQITAYNISCSGIGISFVSDTLIKSIAFSNDIALYNLVAPLSERNIYLYHKRNHYQSIACRKFIECNIIDK